MKITSGCKRAPIDHSKITDLLIEAFQLFGGKLVSDALSSSDEPFFPSMKGYEKAGREGESIVGLSKLKNMTVARNKLQKDYLDRWQATSAGGRGPIDGLITPVTPWAAARLGVTQKMSYIGYTGVFNLLGKSNHNLLFPIYVPTDPSLWRSCGGDRDGEL